MKHACEIMIYMSYIMCLCFYILITFFSTVLPIILENIRDEGLNPDTVLILHTSETMIPHRVRRRFIHLHRVFLMLNIRGYLKDIVRPVEKLVSTRSRDSISFNVNYVKSKYHYAQSVRLRTTDC